MTKFYFHILVRRRILLSRITLK